MSETIDDALKNYPDKIFTIGQVARVCRVAPRTAGRWFDSGRLKGYRVPGSQDRRVPREYLVKFLEEHGTAFINSSAVAKECSIQQSELEELRKQRDALLEACRKAVKELNEIRARDGVPYTHYHTQASVCPDYFSSVVDECFAAIAMTEDKSHAE